MIEWTTPTIPIRIRGAAVMAPNVKVLLTFAQGGYKLTVEPRNLQATEDGVRDRALAVIAPIEGATASTNYAVNAYLIHDGGLYRVTSAIATGEAIAPGTNCIACTVMGEVIRLTA